MVSLFTSWSQGGEHGESFTLVVREHLRKGGNSCAKLLLSRSLFAFEIGAKNSGPFACLNRGDGTPSIWGILKYEER